MQRLRFGLGDNRLCIGVGAALNLVGLAFALCPQRCDFTVALRLHTLEHLLGDAFWQFELFDPDELNRDAVVFLGVRLNPLKDFLLDLRKLELLFVCGNKMGEGMFADDADLGIPNRILQPLLCFFNSSGGKTTEENIGIADGPACVHRNEQIVTVTGQRRLECVLEILNALVERVHRLDWARQFEMQSRVFRAVVKSSWFVKGRHHRDFGLAHLEGE